MTHLIKTSERTYKNPSAGKLRDFATPKVVKTSKFRRGTNQYKKFRKDNEVTKYRITDAWLWGFWKGVCSLAIFIIMIEAGIYHMQNQYVSPLPKSGSMTVYAAEAPTATPTMTPTPTQAPVEYQVIEKEIREVFGSHADKALLLLGGKPEICSENARLNPRAINENKNEAGEVTSRDYGVFQINDYWQGFRHEGKAEQFLLDPEINIRVAWSIYRASGYSFERWTCGRLLGI